MGELSDVDRATLLSESDYIADHMANPLEVTDFLISKKVSDEPGSDFVFSFGDKDIIKNEVGNRRQAAKIVQMLVTGRGALAFDRLLQAFKSKNQAWLAKKLEASREEEKARQEKEQKERQEQKEKEDREMNPDASQAGASGTGPDSESTMGELSAVDRATLLSESDYIADHMANPLEVADVLISKKVSDEPGSDFVFSFGDKDIIKVISRFVTHSPKFSAALEV